MQPSRHLALSTANGGALWATTGEPRALPVTVGAGVLVDLDHGPDCWWTFALGHKPVATFVLHAWEWLAGLVALGIWTGFPWWLVAVLSGYGLHLITDNLFNRGGTWSYSLVYRARHRFLVERLAPGWNLDRGYDVLRKEIPFAVRLIEWWGGRRLTRREAACEVEHRCSKTRELD